MAVDQHAGGQGKIGSEAVEHALEVGDDEPDKKQEGGDNEEEKAVAAANDDMNPPDEEQLAAEQWLRRIPDDPGGLLRQKFRYQYQQRRGDVETGEKTW